MRRLFLVAIGLGLAILWGCARNDPSPAVGSGVTTTPGAAVLLTLLVVDDEPDLRNIIVRLLERRNHEVDAAGDGDEAWGKLQGQTYDCILLDLRMAGTSGQELFQRLNAADPVMAGKIIFLTGDMANTSTRSFLDPSPISFFRNRSRSGTLSR